MSQFGLGTPLFLWVISPLATLALKRGAWGWRGETKLWEELRNHARSTCQVGPAIARSATTMCSEACRVCVENINSTSHIIPLKVLMALLGALGQSQS